MLNADRPITNSSEDRLGRTPFAKSLARSILDHTDLESLVIGLYGSWGSGKTSVLNLMREELDFAASNMFDDEKPIIVECNAWAYAGEHFIYHFFHRLSSVLRAFPHLENSEKIIRLLDQYIFLFTDKSIHPEPHTKKHWWKKSESNKGESSGDLDDLKFQLNELLKVQKHKIIIVIDNITQLDNVEVKQLFQLVKSLANFANTVYVLALDPERMVSVLNHKIVQLPFSIPAISQQDIQNILLEKLTKTLDLVPQEAWSKDYWTDIYFAGFHHFFHNVREITRYANTLNFSYIYFRDVVNPIDFFVMTAIEILLPEVYLGIHQNKDLFTDLMDHVYELDAKSIAEDKARCDEVLSHNAKIKPEWLLQVLIRLFPRLRYIYQSAQPFYHSETVARKNKRICSPDLFDAYFRLSMPGSDIHEGEFSAILDMIDDEKGFALALLRLNHDDRILKFLNVFDSIGLIKIKEHNIGHAVEAFIDSADMFPQGESSLLKFDTPSLVHRILHQLLKKVPAEIERFEIFRQAIKKSVNSIYSIVYELNAQTQQHQEGEDTFVPAVYRDFTEEQLDVLKKIAVGKIVYWAETGRLIEHPKVIPILQAWKAWGNEVECRRYVEHVVEIDKGLLAFLCAALKEPIDETITHYVKSPAWQKYLSHIEDFIPLQSIESHVREIFEDLEFEKLREREQLAVLIFLDLIHADTLKVFPKTS